jgi:5-methylcytosine-specific restriction protein A
VSPAALLRPCAVPRCPNLSDQGRCLEHRRVKALERRRDEPGRKWYATARWQALRLAVLADYPLCDDCQARGYVTASREVDHTIPHRGNPKLFWDRKNLRGKCSPCHASKTRRGE